MKVAHLNTIFFFLLLLAVGILAFFVLQPFLTAILVAAVLATLFRRPYRFFLRIFRNRGGLSAAFTMLLVAIAVILPIFFVITIALDETTGILEGFAANGSSIPGLAHQAENWVLDIPYVGEMLRNEGYTAENFLGNFSDTSGFLLNFLQALYGSVASFTLWIFAMFFTLFYFLVDGEKAVRFLKRISPLRDEEDDELMSDFVSISRAIIKGSLVVAIVQGVLGGFAFFIVGLSSPVVWGMVMAFLSLIPVLGTGLIWFPAAIWFLLSGQVWEGIFLIAFGFGIVSTIDNVLRPRLVGRDTAIHPLLVFFATLGGLSLFGIAGFLIGPIVVSLFVALVRIYGREFKQQLSAYNQGRKE